MYNYLQLDPTDIPTAWAPIISYLTIVDACEIKINTKSSDILIRLLLGVRSSKDLKEQAATVMLAAKYIRETGDISVLACLVAMTLDENTIEKVEASAFAPAGSHDFLLRRDEDLLLYLFIKCVDVGRDAAGVQYLRVNLLRVEEEASQVAGFGFVSGEAKMDVADAPSISVLNVADQHQRQSEGRRDKAARRFLRADMLRQKLAPLVVKTVSSVKIADPQRPVLSLPMRRRAAPEVAGGRR